MAVVVEIIVESGLIGSDANFADVSLSSQHGEIAVDGRQTDAGNLPPDHVVDRLDVGVVAESAHGSEYGVSLFRPSPLSGRRSAGSLRGMHMGKL